VLGPDGVSVKKNVFAQRAEEILGILADYTTAIEKMFYLLFFSIDVQAPQTLR
jgi:hypothetical protein